MVACLFFESSQKATCPQIRQSLKRTQVSPSSRHSLQPLPLGCTLRISFRCLQRVAIVPSCLWRNFPPPDPRIILAGHPYGPLRNQKTDEFVSGEIPSARHLPTAALRTSG